MPSPRRPFLTTAATVAVAGLIAGCSIGVVTGPSAPPAVGPSASPSSRPSASVSSTGAAPSSIAPAPSLDPAEVVAACPPEPITLETLIGLRLDGGPLSDRYLSPVNERALSCLKGSTLAFTAFVATPEGLGGTVAYQLTPSWIDTWNSAATFLAASDRDAARGAPNGPFLPVAVPPNVRPAFESQRGHWVTVSGRLDALAARTCVAAPGSAPDVPTPSDLVDMCRTSFVLDSIVPGTDPCPVNQALKAIVATPEDGRADCFGGVPVSFVAAGSSINNVWPGMTRPSGYRDWAFSLDSLDPDASIWVFMPDSMPLPDPAGTPWANRDGVGGPDAFWKVVGHFDDELAEECLPDAGYSLETATHDVTTVVRSKGEVHAFCRNHFVVDRLTWLPDATASTVAG